MMELNEVRDFLNKQRWIFAKTYAKKAPHEYCLLSQVNGTKEEYIEVARYIFENGVTMSYWGHERKYLFLDGRMYWSMDPTPEATDLINRCNNDEYYMTVAWRGPKK